MVPSTLTFRKLSTTEECIVVLETENQKSQEDQDDIRKTVLIWMNPILAGINDDNAEKCINVTCQLKIRV